MYALGQSIEVPVTTFEKAGDNGEPLFGGRGLPQMRYIGKDQKEIGFYPGSPDSLGYMYYKWYVLGMRNVSTDEENEPEYNAKWNDSFSADMVDEIETYWNEDQLNDESRFREWYKWHMNYTENVYIAKCIETICKTYTESIPERIIIPVAISIQKHISDLNRITETRHTREIQFAFANTIRNIINALVKKHDIHFKTFKTLDELCRFQLSVSHRYVMGMYGSLHSVPISSRVVQYIQRYHQRHCAHGGKIVGGIPLFGHSSINRY